jgi:hypothetical protein
MRCEESRNMRYRERTRDDTTASGKVVEETTGSAIRSVDGTNKTLTRQNQYCKAEKIK